MSDEVTRDEWKSSLDFFRSHRASYTTDETLRRRLALLDEFMRFTEPKGAILDVGCGSGDYKRYGHLEGYTGIDPIEDRASGFPFVKGVGEYLPFKDGTFDCVVTTATLDHCQNPGQVMVECSRVLRRNGRIFIWIEVTRTDVAYKLKRTLHYIRTLDFSSLATSLRSNIGTLTGKDEDLQQYGHTHSFTESSLMKLVSRSFDIAKVKWHDQDAFIVGRKQSLGWLGDGGGAISLTRNGFAGRGSRE